MRTWSHSVIPPPLHNEITLSTSLRKDSFPRIVCSNATDAPGMTRGSRNWRYVIETRLAKLQQTPHTVYTPSLQPGTKAKNLVSPYKFSCENLSTAWFCAGGPQKISHFWPVACTSNCTHITILHTFLFWLVTGTPFHGSPCAAPPLAGSHLPTQT